MKREEHRIVIVGAGLAGLTAAAYLSRAGFDVLLLEQREQPGGLLNSFERDGFVFDGGARSIENSGIIRPMLTDLGIDLELLDSPVSIGIGSDVIDFHSRESIGEYEALLARLYPDNGAEVHAIFRKITRVMRDMDVIYGFDNPIFRDLQNDRSYIFRELLPWLGKFLLAVRRMEKMDQPIEEYLKRFSDNRSLRDIIAQHFFRSTPTFFALGYFFVYLDYLYPKRGTGNLAKAIAERAKDFGAKIQAPCTVTGILPAEKRVLDSSGDSYSYDTLIWCADLKSLYRILDTDGLENQAVDRIQATGQRLNSSRGGDSIFSLYLGLDAAPEAYARISNGHFFYTPSPEGLAATHREELEAIVSDFSSYSREEIHAWLERYCRLNTYEISIPALRDASLAPAGKTGLIASILFEYDLIRSIHDAGWYEEFREKVADRMIDTLAASIYPDLREQVIFRFSSTPLTIERDFGTSEGGITGWTYERPVPVVNELRKIPKAVKTPIDGIYQAGQWAYSPAGIPTAILTGKYAADDIIKRNR